MTDRIEERLAELREQWQAGRELRSELDARRADLEGRMLRIAGAIQVLEELRDGEEKGLDRAAAPLRAASG